MQYALHKICVLPIYLLTTHLQGASCGRLLSVPAKNETHAAARVPDLLTLNPYVLSTEPASHISTRTCSKPSKSIWMRHQSSTDRAQVRLWADVCAARRLVWDECCSRPSNRLW